MPLLIKVVLKFANFLSPQKRTSPRGEGAAAVALQRAFSPSPTHSPACSSGETPLKEAMKMNMRSAVAYLQSIGAPE